MPITLDEARAGIGRNVMYERQYCDREPGVITSVNDSVVFVRYAGQHPDANGKATSPQDLTFITHRAG